MKSLKEIEEMSIEELELVSSDENIAVPGGFAERMHEMVGARRILEELESDEARGKKAARWMGAAAAVAVMAGIGFGMTGSKNEPKDTFDDPYLAYAHLEKTFAAMSEGVRKGMVMADRSEAIIGKAASIFEE